MEVKEMRTFIKATIIIWSLAFVGGFITGKSAFATHLITLMYKIIPKL